MPIARLTPGAMISAARPIMLHLSSSQLQTHSVSPVDQQTVLRVGSTAVDSATKALTLFSAAKVASTRSCPMERICAPSHILKPLSEYHHANSPCCATECTVEQPTLELIL